MYGILLQMSKCSRCDYTYCVIRQFDIFDKRQPRALPDPTLNTLIDLASILTLESPAMKRQDIDKADIKKNLFLIKQHQILKK